MFDYLQQFNSLSKELRDQVSSSSALAVISELENKYRIDLAMIVVKVMIKSLAVNNLPAYFISELGLSKENAESLTRELKERIFSSVAGHLNLTGEVRALDLEKDIGLLIKETGLVLPSAVLIGRFKNILATYLRGVRNKIDTRNSLAKDSKIGGLNLNSAEIDRVFKVCESHKFKSVDTGASLAPAPAPAPASRLDKIISKAENASPGPAAKSGEYDLKRALDLKQVKLIKPDGVKLDVQHELSAPAKQLDLPVGKSAGASAAATQEKIASAGELVATPRATAISMAPKKSDFWSGLFKKKENTAPLVSPKPSAPSQPIASVKPAVPVVPAPTPIKPISPASVKPIVPIAPTFSVPVKPVTPITPADTVAPIKPSTPTIAVKRPAPAPSVNRPQMHDIKPMPKVMGPIEELQFLDLVNFRRLGKTPAEMTAKVFSKIKLLESEGYDKMVAGVRAWRQSPVSRLYLQLGQEAIVKGALLKDVIATRQKVGQDYLSQEEIDAIITLNSKLAF